MAGLSLPFDTQDVLSLPPSFVLYGSPGVGKCGRGDEMVLLSNGQRLQLKDVKVGDEVVGLDHDLKLRVAKVTTLHKNGAKKLFKLTTQSGRLFDGWSANHPLYGKDGWTSLESFKLGDFVAVPRALPFFGGDDADENLIKLVAYFVADGTMESSTPCISESNKEKYEDLKQAAEQYGCRLTTTDDKQHRVVQPDTGTRKTHREANRFTTELRSLGFSEDTRAGTKFVPEFIFTLRRPLVLCS